VVLVFELQLQASRFRLVAFAADPEAPTQQAFGLLLIAFDASLFACSAASGASVIDHDGHDAQKRDVVATVMMPKRELLLRRSRFQKERCYCDGHDTKNRDVVATSGGGAVMLINKLASATMMMPTLEDPDIPATVVLRVDDPCGGQ
jgi:hypothetical protein